MPAYALVSILCFQPSNLSNTVFVIRSSNASIQLVIMRPLRIVSPLRQMAIELVSAGSSKPLALRQLQLEGRRLGGPRTGWATLLLAQGVHPKVVQEILGHSQISLTMDTYSDGPADCEPSRSGTNGRAAESLKEWLSDWLSNRPETRRNLYATSSGVQSSPYRRAEWLLTLRASERRVYVARPPKVESRVKTWLRGTTAS